MTKRFSKKLSDDFQAENLGSCNNEHQRVTMSEFEDWTITWLIEKFIVTSQEPHHVITANVPVIFFMRDMMREEVFPRDATFDEIKIFFYTNMLSLYRRILRSDEWQEHAPHIQTNHANVIQYAKQCLSELKGNSEYSDRNASI